MGCDVGCRYGSDLALLWLWHRPAATVWIQPLAWEPPHAAGASLKKDEKNKKENQWLEDFETQPNCYSQGLRPRQEQNRSSESQGHLFQHSCLQQ